MTNALDMSDADTNGVIDRWDKYFAEHPSNGDSDGDGFSDAEEQRAGTGLLDSQSFLGVAYVTFLGDDALIEWDSVAGKRYQIEYSDDLVGDAFSPIGSVVTATSSLTQVTLTNALAGAPRRQFRVTLYEGP